MGMKNFITSMLSGHAGESVSSARAVLVITTFTGLAMMSYIIHHLTTLKDPALLAAWLPFIPSISTFLVTLAAAPYAANKVTGVVAGITAAVASAAPKTSTSTSTSTVTVVSPQN